MSTASVTPEVEPIDEAELIQALQEGDPAAYERMVRLYGGRMLAVARRFLVNEEDARDAVQDAFLAAFRAIERFDGRAMLSSWLHRITVNAALTRLRTRKRRPEQLIDDFLPKFLDDGHQAEPASPWAESAAAVLERKELRDLVRQSIEQLPDSYRAVLLLRDIEQLNTDETARLLGMNPNAVKTRLHRARQALRTLLDPHLRGVTV